MRVLVLGELAGDQVADSTLHALSAAFALGGPVTLVLLGSDLAAAGANAASIPGVATVKTVAAAHLAEPTAEDAAAVLVALAGPADHVLAASTSFGKNVLPRVAALLDVAQVSDIVAVEKPGTYKRYIYAGNALATVVAKDPRQVITVRTTAFAKAPATGGSATVEAVAAPAASPLSQFVGRDVQKSERPDLTSAKVVVSGGRGLGSGENFQILDALADELGAAVGASRAAVDAGYVPNDYQVGQTGKIVAPELYLAVGISGAIQHLAGMKDSKVIVAINKDEEAPIFQVADFGLVGDLFKLVPELTAAIKRAKSA